MKEYLKKIEIRWADLDPNFHMLHSKYYDIGAYSRMSFMTENGITPELMKINHLGPIIFREECLFKKEINFGDELLVNLKLSKCKEDVSRWSMIHELWINGADLAAVITIDGAWINTTLRKLAIPPEFVKACFDLMPKTDHFNSL